MNIKAINKKLMAETVIGIVLIVAGVAFRPIMILASVFCVLAILADKNDNNVFCLMFAWLNVSQIFHFTVSSPTVYTFLELALILKLFIKYRKIHFTFVIIMIILLFYLVAGVGSAYFEMIKALMIPILFYYMSRLTDYSGLSNISKYYVFGVIVGSVIGYFKNYIPNMSLLISYKRVNTGAGLGGMISEDRFSGLWVDPNYYTVHLVLSVLIIAILFSRVEIHTLTFYIGYILITLFGGMTGSKSFLFCLTLATVFIMYSTWNSKNRKQLIFFVIMIILVLFLMFTGYIDVFSRVIARLDGSSQSQSGITTGRMDRWIVYMDTFLDNPFALFFGQGLGNGFSYLIPHNTYIDFIDIFGIVGTTLFFMPIGFSIYVWDNKRRGSVVPLLFLLVLYFFLSMIYSIDFVFELFIAIGLLVLAPGAGGYRLNSEGFGASASLVR